MCIIAVDILRGFLAIVAAVSIFCSTPARIQMFIFCKGGDITNDGRSILASFFFSKRRKKGQEAPFHLSYAISSPFFFFIYSLVDHFFFQTLALYCFVISMLKMHYLLPSCKERFSIHTALVQL